MNHFLRNHDIDVGRSLALIVFAGACLHLLTVIGHALIGQVDLDFGVLIMAFFGYGLWRHRKWARLVLLVLTWAGAVLIFLLTLNRVIGFPVSNYVLTIGEVTIKNPNVSQSLVGGIVGLAFFSIVLALLHSKKAIDEFDPA